MSMAFQASAEQFPRLDRRDWLRLAVPTLMSTCSVARATGLAPGFGRAKSVLVVFTGGGQSQLDTYDPKPDAPEEIRGAFTSIPTRIPGVRFCEHLPRLAERTDRLCVVRSVTHDDVDHGSAVYLALTGRFHPRKSSNPDPTPNDLPTLGAVVRRVRPLAPLPHAAAYLNGPLLVPEQVSAGQSTGVLGRRFAPFTVGNPSGGRLVDPPAELADRTADRQRLLERLDRSQPGRPADYPATIAQAFDVLRSEATQKAFDLTREPDAVRDRYGRHRAGQTCLLARRLVEAGVPWVTAFFNHSVRGQDKSTEPDAFGWDTHNDIFETLKHSLLPRFDATVSTLLDDLHDRGLLATTLVVILGEFGRAPRVALEKTFAGTAPGRKHWAGCYSLLLAGAGVTPGRVYGRSDRFAAYPSENPIGPPDVTATLLHALGISAETTYTDDLGRPYEVTTGKPLLDLFR